MPPRDPVHGAGEARANRLHPTAKRVSILRLDDEMGVVSL